MIYMYIYKERYFYNLADYVYQQTLVDWNLKFGVYIIALALKIEPIL